MRKTRRQHLIALKAALTTIHMAAINGVDAVLLARQGDRRLEHVRSNLETVGLQIQKDMPLVEAVIQETEDADEPDVYDTIKKLADLLSAASQGKRENFLEILFEKRCRACFANTSILACHCENDE